MNRLPPSEEEIRSTLINTPRFYWPEFAAMPLNCFDLTAALLTFPGNITESRDDPYSDCANFRIDINDLNTCPRFHSFFETERWNETSLSVQWFLGRLHWVCSIPFDDFFSINQGYFKVYVNVKRFQNLDGINNVNEPQQLKSAMYRCMKGAVDGGSIKDFPEDSITERIINGRTWTIARSLAPGDIPIYNIATPIDYRTALYIGVELDNDWFAGEALPEEVEQKYLESLWDYIGHITIHPAGSNVLEAGTFYRETPGQAEKVEDDFKW